MSSGVPSRPVAVAHITESLGRGGAERNLVNRIRAGDRSAFRHHVYCLFSDAALASEVTDAGASVTLLGGRRPRDIAVLLPELVRRVRSFRPDVIHTQLVAADVAGRLAALALGRIPVVTTLQNLPYDPRAAGYELPNIWARRLVRAADAASSRLVPTRFLAVSETVRASYARELGIPAERIAIVYNAVDCDILRSSAPFPTDRARWRHDLGLPSAGPLLISVARHVPQKGLNYLLAAMPALRGKGVTLVLVGTGGCTQALRRQAQASGITESILFLGTRDDVPSLMRAADVFVFPSLYEGLPLALLEALALEVPTVASDIPEIREITSDDGARLVPPADVAALARAVATVLDAPDVARQMARRASQRVRDRFDVVNTTSRFERVLLEAAKSHGRRPRRP